MNATPLIRRSIGETLRQLALEAHTVIKLTAISSEEEPHSTVATFLINPDGSCHWAHAGDSRIYFFRDRQLVKRTLDHSYVQTLVNQGEITAEQANFHPRSNILMGCLGTEKEPPLDVDFIPKLTPGDTLLVCSDGVWHYFNEMELGSVLATLSARDASEFLIEKARSRAKGGGDNLSLAVVKIEPLADVQAENRLNPLSPSPPPEMDSHFTVNDCACNGPFMGLGSFRSDCEHDPVAAIRSAGYPLHVAPVPKIRWSAFRSGATRCGQIRWPSGLRCTTVRAGTAADMISLTRRSYNTSTNQVKRRASADILGGSSGTSLSNTVWNWVAISG